MPRHEDKPYRKDTWLYPEWVIVLNFRLKEAAMLDRPGNYPWWGVE